MILLNTVEARGLKGIQGDKGDKGDKGDTGKVITDGTQYYSILDVADSDISKYTEVELTNDIQKAMEGQQ